ncbi:hypothetical protein X975_25550, partial [Stegodyphus mimosarum]
MNNKTDLALVLFQDQPVACYSKHRARNECTVLQAELLSIYFAVKWIKDNGTASSSVSRDNNI